MVAPRLNDPLTADELRERLDYIPSTGAFWWKERAGNVWWNTVHSPGRLPDGTAARDTPTSTSTSSLIALIDWHGCG